MTVRVAGPDDWAAWRDLRLEALRDTPIGFVETYQNASAKDEQAWRQRMADVPLSVLAGSAGRVVGMSSGFLIDGRPFLGAVYVTPAHRGAGVLAALTAPVVAWARALKATELLLEGRRPSCCSRCTRGTCARGRPTPGSGSSRPA